MKPQRVHVAHPRGLDASVSAFLGWGLIENIRSAEAKTWLERSPYRSQPHSPTPRRNRSCDRLAWWAHRHAPIEEPSPSPAHQASDTADRASLPLEYSHPAFEKRHNS